MIRKEYNNILEYCQDALIKNYKNGVKKWMKKTPTIN